MIKNICHNCGENIGSTAMEDYPICLAVAFDIKKNLEIDLIGVIDSISSAVSCAETAQDIPSSAPSDVRVTFRPYGSLLFDLDTVSDENASGNVLRQYLTDKADYIRNHSGYDNDTANRLISAFADQCKADTAELLISGFKRYRKEYSKIYRYAFAEKAPFSDNTLYCMTVTGDIGFIAVSYDLSPIFKSYIMDCGRNHKFLKRCKLCHSMMLGSLSNIEELCSDECRKKSHNAAVGRFKERQRSDEHEKMYRSAYLRLLHIKHKLIDDGYSDEEIFTYTNQFTIFQKETMKQKKELCIEDFGKWLKEQERMLREIAADIQGTAQDQEKLAPHVYKKQEYPEKYVRYIERHNTKYQAQYMKVYRKWYARIRRAKVKDQLFGDALKICDYIFSAFTKESYDMRNDAQSGKISPVEFTRWLDNFDNKMNALFSTISKKEGVNSNDKR